MYCQKCGAENLENATMCQQCGGVFVYSQPTRTSGTAITSMILGISGFSMFGVFGVTWIIGLIFGILSLNKISKSGGTLKGKGFAIAGIITSAIGLAIVLTIFGVWMFINSAQTASLKRQLAEVQNGITITEVQGRPKIEGFVVIEKAAETAQKILFNPEQAQQSEGVITTKFIANLGGEQIEIKWQFVGSDAEGDMYNFAMTVPIDEDSSGTVAKQIIYSGSKELLYEKNDVKIFVSGAGQKQKDTDEQIKSAEK